MNALTELRKLAKEKPVTIEDRGNGHIQIRGALLVNWWPESKKRSAHIGQTREAFTDVNAARALALALEPPPVVAVNTIRKGHYRAAKTKMYRRQKNCNWCCCPLSLDGNVPGTVKATLDHVIPLKRGGLDNPNNWVLSCEPCNTKRGHHMPEITQRSTTK